MHYMFIIYLSKLATCHVQTRLDVTYIISLCIRYDVYIMYIFIGMYCI